MNKNIILIGGGGHCASCIDVIEQEGIYQIAGIVDKNYDGKSLGYPSLGDDSHLENLKKKFDFAFITFGQMQIAAKRIAHFKLLKLYGFEIPNIISPRAYISKNSILSEGIILMHGAIVNSKASVGDNCIINTNALIEHDAVIESNCHISTGAIVNGSCLIKEGTFVGSNATSVDSAVTKQGDFIKAGSLFKKIK